MYYINAELTTENPRKRNYSTKAKVHSLTSNIFANIPQSPEHIQNFALTGTLPQDAVTPMDILSQNLVNSNDFLSLFSDHNIKNKKQSIDRLYERRKQMFNQLIGRKEMQQMTPKTSKLKNNQHRIIQWLPSVRSSADKQENMRFSVLTKQRNVGTGFDNSAGTKDVSFDAQN